MLETLQRMEGGRLGCCSGLRGRCQSTSNNAMGEEWQRSVLRSAVVEVKLVLKLLCI